MLTSDSKIYLTRHAHLYYLNTALLMADLKHSMVAFMRRSRLGEWRVRTPSPGKSHKSCRFALNIGPDPLENHILATQLVFNVGGHHQSASEPPFNPFMPNGIFHCYKLDQFISVEWLLGSVFIFIQILIEFTVSKRWRP